MAYNKDYKNITAALTHDQHKAAMVIKNDLGCNMSTVIKVGLGLIKADFSKAQSLVSKHQRVEEVEL